MSHTHALFKLDNAEVFDLLETAVHGSDIAPTIAPFRKLRNGRGALQAIKNQHAGVRVWDDIVKTAKEVMGGSRKLTGLSSFILAQQCNLHRKAYISLGEAADHVPVQIPDERTRVTNLMDSLDTVDPTVLAAVSSVRQDEFNKRVNFEAAVTFLVQSCPAAIKQNKKKVSFDASLSAIEVAPGKGTQKSKMGTTGVPLRYHPKAEFIKLNRAQREEVAAWVKANPKKGDKRKRDDNDGTSGSRPKKWNSKLSAISARQEEVMAAMVESQKAGLEAMASSIASLAPQRSVVASTTPVFTDVTVMNERAHVAMMKLQGILKPPSGKPPTFPAP